MSVDAEDPGRGRPDEIATLVTVRRDRGDDLDLGRFQVLPQAFYRGDGGAICRHCLRELIPPPCRKPQTDLRISFGNIQARGTFVNDIHDTLRSTSLAPAGIDECRGESRDQSDESTCRAPPARKPDRPQSAVPADALQATLDNKLEASRSIGLDRDPSIVQPRRASH